MGSGCDDVGDDDEGDGEDAGVHAGETAHNDGADGKDEYGAGEMVRIVIMPRALFMMMRMMITMMMMRRRLRMRMVLMILLFLMMMLMLLMMMVKMMC